MYWFEQQKSGQKFVFVLTVKYSVQRFFFYQVNSPTVYESEIHLIEFITELAIAPALCDHSDGEQNFS